MKTAETLKLKKPNRQARLNAWFVLHGVEKRKVARAIDVTPQMLSAIIAGNCAPKHRIEALVALGVPRRLLPEPSDGRPGPKPRSEPQDHAA